MDLKIYIIHKVLVLIKSNNIFEFFLKKYKKLFFFFFKNIFFQNSQ